MRMVCTMALRSLKNHNSSLWYRGLFLKNVFRATDGADGARSALAKPPARPRRAPQTLYHTPPAIRTTAASQQLTTPEMNENEPSGRAPTNHPNHGQGINAATCRRTPSRVPTICGIANAVGRNDTMDA